jgi:soluble lytic murein transglycosylase-like protein
MINLCFVVAGFLVIDRAAAIPQYNLEIKDIPAEASLPFRQMTREEKTRRNIEALTVDPTGLPTGDVSDSIKPWEPYIMQYAVQYKVDPDLIGAILYAESKGDPFKISRDGALGLMQIMPATADYLGCEDALEPEENIKAGAMYISQLMKNYGETHAVWAWNAGPARVDNNHMPNETRIFIEKVLSIKNYLKKQRTNAGVS